MIWKVVWRQIVQKVIIHHLQSYLFYFIAQRQTPRLFRERRFPAPLLPRGQLGAHIISGWIWTALEPFPLIAKRF